MMRTKTVVLLISLMSIMTACNDKNEKAVTVKYPLTMKCDSSDTYFGTKIADPYRWLENDTAPDVKAWVDSQNAVTFSYLKNIPYREQIKQRLTHLWNYPRQSAPFKKAGMIFFYKNDGLQNQSVLYMQENNKSEAKVLLDPNTLSTDGTVSLAGIDISKDGKYIAYSISRGGSDWNEIFVMDIVSKKLLSDKIEWVKFSGISWFENGFFYSGYEKPEKGKELSQKNQFHKLYYHQLGTPQEKDQIIRENKNAPQRSHYATVTDDAKYLIVYEEEANKSGNAVYIKDLGVVGSKFVAIEESFDYQHSIIHNNENIFYVKTNKNAGKYKLISFDFDKPDTASWVDILPERPDLLQSISIVNKKIIANYLKDAHSQLEIYNTEGKFMGEIELPVIGTVNSFNTEKDDDEAFYDFTSFNYPTTIFKYSLSSGKSEVFFSPKVDFNSSDYEVKQVFYNSKDGNRIPMFITYKKGIILDGTNPTLLYGYGGFNISLSPSFSITRLLWLENGGIYVMANLRGGGEYGESWHLSGTKLKKQNVFDDFIAAAEYLIKEKYTSPAKLAIQGGSNGGLLVGAVANQRPDLFRVALPAVGVMDMLRYHKFTIGWAWVTDYGSSEDSLEFNYILTYSPLHNIKEGVNYPATMVTTADHDDRVVPAHSFKYIATLQEKYKGPNPVLIRIETQAGHGAGKSTTKMIDESTDILSFTLYNMGIEKIK